jgi:hypothetical protein
MRAINHTKHNALTAALEHLAELCGSDLTSLPEHIDAPNPAVIRQGLLALSNTFAQYHSLLNELERKILEYEDLHYKIRSNVLIPGLRRQQHLTRPQTKEYNLLREAIELSRAI